MTRSLKLAKLLSKWLDKSYLDPILGLVLPEIGDFASTVAGFFVVMLAWRDKVAVPVLARMVTNLAIDGIVGAIPIVGDIFDFAFQAHTKNAKLLEEHNPRRATARDYLLLATSLLGLIAAFALPIIALVSLIQWLSARWG